LIDQAALITIRVAIVATIMISLFRDRHLASPVGSTKPQTASADAFDYADLLAHLRARRVGRLLTLGQRAVACGAPVDDWQISVAGTASLLVTAD
jgi:hypothetical protein